MVVGLCAWFEGRWVNIRGWVTGWIMSRTLYLNPWRLWSKKWSTAESRGVSRLLVHIIEAMGESEEPLNSEAHLLGCTSIAGFSDECQDMTRDLCCQECGWGGRNVVLEVSWDPFLECHGSVHRASHGRYVWSVPHIVDHRFCRWD